MKYLLPLITLLTSCQTCPFLFKAEDKNAVEVSISKETLTKHDVNIDIEAKNNLKQ